MDKRLIIKSKAHHRNGVGGVPFTVILFTDTEENRDMMAVVFECDGPCPRTAVFDVKLLCDGNINFAENSWRGDIYHGLLDEAGVLNETE